MITGPGPFINNRESAFITAAARLNSTIAIRPGIRHDR